MVSLLKYLQIWWHPNKHKNSKPIPKLAPRVISSQLNQVYHLQNLQNLLFLTLQ